MQARKPIYKDSLNVSTKFKKHLNQLEKLLKTYFLPKSGLLISCFNLIIF